MINSLFIRNSANTLTKDQEIKFDYFHHNTDDETSEYKNVSTSTEEGISDNPKDRSGFGRKIRYPAEFFSKWNFWYQDWNQE